MPTIAICIPTYNDWDRLDILLKSIQTELDSKKKNDWLTVVIDNASDLSKPESLSYYSVQWLNCIKPGSYAARNVALSLVDADFYFFTDSDCLIDIGTLNEIENLIEGGINDDLVAGNVEMFAADPCSPTSYEALDMIVGLNQEHYVSKGSAVTANLLVSRNVFQKVGLFDESNLSGGDVEFVRRAVSSGFNLKYSKDIRVLHPARRMLKDFKSKIFRIVGAQNDRLGFPKNIFLLPFSVIVLLRTIISCFKSKVGIKLKLKGMYASFILFFFRLYYSSYVILGGSKRQR